MCAKSIDTYESIQRRIVLILAIRVLSRLIAWLTWKFLTVTKVPPYEIMIPSIQSR
jgi:hypothetical protein